jgi:hypothetical protein
VKHSKYSLYIDIQIRNPEKRKKRKLIGTVIRQSSGRQNVIIAKQNPAEK